MKRTEGATIWDNTVYHELASLAAAAVDDFGLPCLSSPPPPSDGLLSTARGSLGEVLGLLFAEEGWEFIRGREAVLCVMVCTTGRRRGKTVVPETEMDMERKMLLGYVMFHPVDVFEYAEHKCYVSLAYFSYKKN